MDGAGNVALGPFAFFAHIDEQELLAAVESGLDVVHGGFADPFLGIGDDVQLRMRPSQGGLDAGRGVGAGKHESEVAIALRQRDQWLARRDGNDQTIDPLDAPRLGLAGDLAEHARVWDRQHHDAGGAAFAIVLGHRQAGGMAEDDFFQRDSRAKPKGARAQPANRSRRDFEHPRTVTVEAKLGVDGTIRQAERPDRASRGLRDQRLGGIGKP